MNNELYNEIKFWLDGDITEEEERELIEAIYSKDDSKILYQIGVLRWRHLGIQYVNEA